MEESGKYGRYPSLAGRVCVVTGGASGIGASVVEALAEQGARVVALDMQDEAAARLVRGIVERGWEAPAYYHCDLRDVGAIQTTIAAVLAVFGRVDVLVNNAGNDTRHALSAVTSEFWDETMAINLKAQFFMAQGIAAAMRVAGGGSIINLSSISWVIPSTGLPVYVTAKAGVVGMTRTLAHELGGDNIRVNCVMPGAVATERQNRLWLTEEYKAEILSRQALKRMIGPEEVARLVLFLAADDSGAITNQSLVIDGGWI